MKIKSITVEGFKSIYKETTLSFDDCGLWKVKGDVGTGKTTIGECILFCLFGGVKDFNVKDLISWGLKKCTASISLESRGYDILIKRIIKTQGQGQLEIFINGTPLEYTNKSDGQQILEEDYYDISRTAVENLCIISVGNFKGIVKISSNSSYSRKFIDDIFGFKIVNKYIESAKFHLSQANEHFNELSTTISTLDTQREKYVIAKEAINEGVDCNKIDALNEQIKIKNKELSDITATYETLSATFRSQRESNMKQMNVIKERGKHVKDVIEKLKNGVCPLCGGVVEARSLDEYNRQRTELLNDYNFHKREYDTAVRELEIITDKYKKDSSAILSEIKSLESEISKINIQKKLLSNNYDKLINDITANIDDLKKKLFEADSERSQWQELYDKLYKDSRSTLLKHYIPTLNKNINFYMQELQQPYIIKFDESFKCTISCYGKDNIPTSNLSVGQGKLVDTAVILGILKTLLNGVNFNISILDELVSNMHEELRNQICVMLKKNMPDKLIFITTHADIDDSYFDGKIKVKLHHWEEDDKLIQNTEYIATKLK